MTAEAVAVADTGAGNGKNAVDVTAKRSPATAVGKLRAVLDPGRWLARHGRVVTVVLGIGAFFSDYFWGQLDWRADGPPGTGNVLFTGH